MREGRSQQKICEKSGLGLITAFVFSLGMLGAAAADTENNGDEQPELAISIISEASAIEPGQTFTAALRLVHKEGWHAYWRNSGGFPMPTTVEWILPEGYEAGPILWPSPRRIISQGYPAFAFEDVDYILTEISVPDDAEPGTEITLHAKVSGQVCKVECIIYREEPTLTLAVEATSTTDAEAAATIADKRDHLPRAMDEHWKPHAFERDGKVFLVLEPLTDKAAEVDDAYFFSYTPEYDGQEDQPFNQQDGRYILEIPPSANPQNQRSDQLEGLVRTSETWIENDPTAHSMEISLTLGEEPDFAVLSPVDAAEPASLSIKIILFALLGGIILNLMPCVFPVLGLKVMHFVNQAGEDRRKVIIHGLTFTLGVLASFWILAAIVISLTSLGNDSVIWGFQLQEPKFNLGISILLLLFGMSLYGVFEIGAGITGVGSTYARKSGLSGSFFSGVLATIVATPCAAPFLGVALGAAFLLPPFEAFVMFTAIAVGLSLPYLILSSFPKLVEALPRPGAWMETFKQIMAFPIFATVAYLLWIYSQQVTADQFLNTLLALTVIALGAYIYGRWSGPHRTKRTRVTAKVSALTILLAGTAFAWPIEREFSVDWEPWSPERVAELREQGRPVFIDFTAAWCVTCQTNKAQYTNNRKVVQLIEQKGVVTLQADNTNEDPLIGETIRDYGRRAVPVNVLYRPGEDAELFPELFGAREMTERLSTLPDWDGPDDPDDQDPTAIQTASQP